MSQTQKRIVSGIKPSGELHLGNYLGSIKQWVEMQHEYETFVFLADLHAITVPQDPEELRQNTLTIIKTYIAAGLDPEQVTIWTQSSVSAHTELGWVLGCLAKMGEMEKMTQFKDKSQKEGAERSGLGLFSYPALMAADIILYDAAVVPVGDDQMQHLELTRTLARRFNERFGETFIVPKAQVQKESARIMALDDPTKKMSKSAESMYSYIALADDLDLARKKIMKAVTDSGTDITYSEARPALENLINIYSLLSGQTPKEIVAAHDGEGFGTFKNNLADVVVAFLSDFQGKMEAVSDANVADVLTKGQIQASAIAKQKIDTIKERVGFITR